MEESCCMKDDSVSEMARKRTATPRIWVRVPSLSLRNLANKEEFYLRQLKLTFLAVAIQCNHGNDSIKM